MVRVLGRAVAVTSKRITSTRMKNSCVKSWAWVPRTPMLKSRCLARFHNWCSALRTALITAQDLRIVESADLAIPASSMCAE